MRSKVVEGASELDDTLPTTALATVQTPLPPHFVRSPSPVSTGEEDYLLSSRIAASRPSMVSGYIRPPRIWRIMRIEPVVSQSCSGTGLSQTQDG